MVLVFFAYFALVSIAAGVLTVSLKHPVHCGLALLALLLHVSGLFILLNAEFLWAVQVIVYAGAILVLYLFVLMLLNSRPMTGISMPRYLYFLAPAAIGSSICWPSWSVHPSQAQKAMRPPAAYSRTVIPTPSGSKCSASTVAVRNCRGVPAGRHHRSDRAGKNAETDRDNVRDKRSKSGRPRS